MANEDSMMDGLLITMVAMASQEMLVEKLEESLKEYKQAMLLNTSEENERKILNGALYLPCLMLLIRCAGKDPIEMIRDLSNIKRAVDLIKPNLG